MARRKKERECFKAKKKANEDLPSPRLLLVTEGEMEDKGLPNLIRTLVAKDKLKFQVLTKTKRIHNGDTVPATKIVKDLNKICLATIGKETEYIACIIDLEGRNCNYQQLEHDIKPYISNNQTVIGIACRTMENWLLGDINGMIQAVGPCNQPNPRNFDMPDNIEHPAVESTPPSILGILMVTFVKVLLNNLSTSNCHKTT